MFERFNDRGRRVLVLAQEEARLLNHNFIGTEHILLGLLDEGEGFAAQALASVGIGLEAARQQVEETIGSSGQASTGSPPFTPRAKKVLELSLRESLHLGHNYIGTEHLLLGLLREGEGVAVQVMALLSGDLGRIRQEVIRLVGGGAPADPTNVPQPQPPRPKGFWRRAVTSSRGQTRSTGFTPLPPEFEVQGEVALTVRDAALTGHIAGNPVDVKLSADRLSGTLGQLGLSAQWRYDDDQAWGPDRPASVRGSIEGKPGHLLTWVQLAGDRSLVYATVDGEMAGLPVTMTVTGGEAGSFGAHGLFAGVDLSLRGVLGRETMTVSGAVSGRPFDVRGEPDENGFAVTGDFDGPSPLLLLLVIAGTHFI